MQLISECNSSIWICDQNRYWLYYIFPRFRNAAIREIKFFVLTNDSVDEKEKYRRWLLKQIGADIYVVETLPFNGFLFEQCKNRKLALIYDIREFDSCSLKRCGSDAT